MDHDSSTSKADEIWRDFYQANPSLTTLRPAIKDATTLLINSFNSGGQTLVCGNGGSAADSEHIAGELAKPCALARPLSPQQRDALRRAGDDGYLGEHLQEGLPVLPLVSQAALLTAIANDQGGDLIFAQQVMAYGRAGDVLWGLSTSGSSTNVVLALAPPKPSACAPLDLRDPTRAPCRNSVMSWFVCPATAHPRSSTPIS